MERSGAYLRTHYGGPSGQEKAVKNRGKSGGGGWRGLSWGEGPLRTAKAPYGLSGGPDFQVCGPSPEASA